MLMDLTMQLLLSSVAPMPSSYGNRKTLRVFLHKVEQLRDLGDLSCVYIQAKTVG